MSRRLAASISRRLPTSLSVFRPDRFPSIPEPPLPRYCAIWEGVAWRSLEHLVVDERGDGARATGTVVGVRERHPFALTYEVVCDGDWRVRSCRMRVEGAHRGELELRSDGGGSWLDEAGRPLADLEGCVDVDIQVTPFTNTLPIRRLGLSPGEERDLVVAYVSVPPLNPSAVAQRYACVSRSDGGGVYRYEGLFRGFAADLEVDDNGLVLDYPETFRRLPT